jgi:hypothetical protein
MEQNEIRTNNQRKQNFSIPTAIIVAGFLIAIGLAVGNYFSEPQVRESKQTSKSSATASIIEQIRAEIIPEENTPTDYGIKIATTSLSQIAQYDKELLLSEAEKQRYNKIIEGIECKYCCGPAPVDRCSCQHAAGYRGLVKYLIKNTTYSDQQIKDEVARWRAFFFPKQVLSEELKKRNINPEEHGLPKMRGEC